MIDRFRLYDACRRDGDARAIERKTVLVNTNCFEALRIACIGQNVLRQLIIAIEIVTEVPIANRRRACLRRKNPALRGADGAGGLWTGQQSP